MCGRCGGCLTKCNKGQVHTTNPRQPDVDSMRHGKFVFEVRGDDYAQPGRHAYPDLPEMGTHTNPAANQAEDGIPRHSLSGQLLARNATRLVRQMDPLVYLAKFNGNIGITLAKSAVNNTIGYDARYDGILPLVLQPIVDKPVPY